MGRNHRGHRVRAGDPRECFVLDAFNFRYDVADEARMVFEILGVVDAWLRPIKGGRQNAA